MSGLTRNRAQQFLGAMELREEKGNDVPSGTALVLLLCCILVAHFFKLTGLSLLTILGCPLSNIASLLFELKLRIKCTCPLHLGQIAAQLFSHSDANGQGHVCLPAVSGNGVINGKILITAVSS